MNKGHGPAVAAVSALMLLAALLVPSQAAAQGRTIWEGFHLGGHLGGTETDFGFSQPNLSFPLAIGDDADTSATGGIVYGTSWQFNQWVVGTDSDWTWGHDDASGLTTGVVNIGTPAVVVLGGPFNVTEVNIDYTSSTRGRLGYLIKPNILLYGTLGIAFAQVELNGSFIAGGEQDERLFGFAYGGGIEVTLPSRWFARVEYIGLDFEDETFADTQGGTLKVDLDTNTVRGAIGFRFDWSPLDLLTGG